MSGSRRSRFLALPLLGSCGFDKATDKVYTPGEGTNNRDGDVKVLAAVVAAAQPGSGTFIATFSNDGTEPDSLTQLSGAGESAELSVADIDSPAEIEPRSFVNLADEGGVTLSGDFGAGDFVELTMTFDSGGSVTMNVPVVYACEEFDGLDTSAEVASESAAPTESAEPTDGTTPSESASAAPAPTQEPYDCPYSPAEE
jgi:hypothetical protein